MDISKHFLTQSAYYLRDYYWPRIREAVDLLTENDVWLREGDASNSIGNLLLHMAGNVRQHIVAGVGQQHEDRRDRSSEFAAVGGMTKKKLLDRLEAVIMEAAEVLDALDPSELMTMRIIQDKEVVLFDDIYHVVEHFGYHTGQIIFIVKALKQHRFGWYKYLDKAP